MGSIRLSEKKRLVSKNKTYKRTSKKRFSKKRKYKKRNYKKRKKIVGGNYEYILNLLKEGKLSELGNKKYTVRVDINESEIIFETQDDGNIKLGLKTPIYKNGGGEVWTLELVEPRELCPPKCVLLIQYVKDEPYKKRTFDVLGNKFFGLYGPGLSGESNWWHSRYCKDNNDILILDNDGEKIYTLVQSNSCGENYLPWPWDCGFAGSTEIQRLYTPDGRQNIIVPSSYFNTKRYRNECMC